MGFNALPDETLEDLQIKGLYILQKKDKFRFGMDAVLLANFVSILKPKRVLDLGTGTGIIPILLAAKTNAKWITGIEIQPDIADMAKRSVEGNGLNDRIEIIEGDLKAAKDLLGAATYDVVVTNPPYSKVGTGFVNPTESKAISRHEIYCTLDDVLDCARSMLKPNGEFYMVHRPERLTDVITGMRWVKIEPKILRMVVAKEGQAPGLFLIKGLKNGNAGLKIMPNLVIYDQWGNYTEELCRIYGLNM
ncbi:MAG: tRNA1(Val) (adenine(37)-N6)-methyltransferase [Clostridiaceae bacterium]|nr:tRNA1(Val) (adenine(37)-N6)-methyltransferase [Clostridiaceae bacterium]